MDIQVYNFRVNLNWELLNIISQIDRFDGSWATIERQQRQGLKELKAIATVRSVGASTRIEGSILTDEAVDVLLKDIDVSKLEDRDAQEVVGYFEALDTIADSYNNIEISSGDIKNLHNMLMKYSKKDEWHKGGYKQLSNAVEAKYPDGTTQILFQTSAPGIVTTNAMSSLENWYKDDQSVHPLVKCAIYTYEFLSIHPFQDGNGRLSRLLSALLLLKSGYKWIQYVSFEHEIENRKLEYYKILRGCQSQRPNENITEWIHFFLDSLKNIQVQLMLKLQTNQTEYQLLPREILILNYIQNRFGCKTGEISKKLGISRLSVIRSLSVLIEKDLIDKHGAGSGTSYSIK